MGNAARAPLRTRSFAIISARLMCSSMQDSMTAVMAPS